MALKLSQVIPLEAFSRRAFLPFGGPRLSHCCGGGRGAFRSSACWLGARGPMPSVPGCGGCRDCRGQGPMMPWEALVWGRSLSPGKDLGPEGLTRTS